MAARLFVEHGNPVAPVAPGLAFEYCHRQMKAAREIETSQRQCVQQPGARNLLQPAQGGAPVRCGTEHRLRQHMQGNPVEHRLEPPDDQHGGSGLAPEQQIDQQRKTQIGNDEGEK